MPHTKMTSAKKAGAAAALALGVAGTGAAVLGLPAAAGIEPLKLMYSCDYPLIGFQDVAVSIDADLPSGSVPLGAPGLAPFAITATATIPAETTAELNLMRGATLEGAALADAAVKFVGDTAFQPLGTGVNTAIEPTPIPAEGAFSVVAKGLSPKVSLTTEEPGWMPIEVGNLKLTLTIKDKAGVSTALGQFTVQCYQKPGQKNLLWQVAFGDDPGPKPEQPNLKPLWVGDWTRPGLDGRRSVNEFVYTCRKLPILGSQKFKIKTIVDYPVTVPSGVYAPKIRIDSVTTLNEDTVEGLNLIYGTGIQGSAVASAELYAADVPKGAGLGVQIQLPIPKTEIPQSDFGPWRAAGLPAAGSAPSLVFKQPGDAKMTVGDITISMTPYRAGGEPTDIGSFTRTCVMDPGQDPTVAAFTVPVNRPPTTPAGMAASAITQTSFHLDFADSTDPDGDKVVRYEVWSGVSATAKLLAYSATSEADIPNLLPGSTYRPVVKAYDERGAVSATSAPLPVTTLEEGAEPEPPAPAAPDPAPKKPAETTAPAPPAGLKASAVTPASFRLDWDDVQGAVRYELFVNGQKMPGEATGSDAEITGLTAGTKYVVTVVAVGAKDDKSEASAALEVTTGT